MGKAAGYPWSVRLEALLPAWMPWIRKGFQLSPDKERQLLLISPRQMDRRLAAKKNQKGRRIYGRTKPGYLLKHYIPIKTDEVAGMLPFPLLGLDSDSGSEFINWYQQARCERKHIQLTRGRPYKKDDNAHIEQKNWTPRTEASRLGTL